ncbi:MAG: purine-nucleoside phosphorylase, partial [Lachnospiraceae bacterium]|nr:purine-nucleoside phosphorylase [Lachnospiraceae bacterium]
MNTTYKKLIEAYNTMKDQIPFIPKVGLVLGSGLGDYGDSVEVEACIPYKSIKGFPVSTVQGHKGCFLFAHVGDTPVVMMQGRIHYYEGYPIQDVVMPIRLMKLMGAEILFLTNAAGGMGEGFGAGDFMMITDHINLQVPSPLIGANIEELGPRFPDMSEVYDKDLRELIRKKADCLQIPLKEGVYMQFSGPQFESPAEVQMAKRLGADAVGMSTVCEAIAANHMGMKICGISCI